MNSDALIDKKIGEYQIVSVLGSGGMATVFKATNKSGELVALKLFAPPPGLEEDLRARFERETKMASQLDHPAIVPVLDVGYVSGYNYMVMQLIDGLTLAERLKVVGHFDEQMAAEIAWQMADALNYAHSQHIVHRDVKPSNILISRNGQAMLADFGVALAIDDPALTRTGQIVGTPAYLAPEQAAGQRPIDGRADIYALGIVLYQMLTGQMPFQGSTPQVLHAHVYTPPQSPATLADISPEIELVVLRALAKDRDLRFQTGADMAKALARLGQEIDTQTQVRLPPTRTMPPLTPSEQKPPVAPPIETPHLSLSNTPTPQSSVKSRLMDNPFFYGGAVRPRQFYGRQDILQATIQRINASQSVSIVGERRIGKSSLLNYFRAQADHYLASNVVIVYLDLMKAFSRTRQGVMKAMRRTLTQLWREPWSVAEDGDLMAFDFALEELQADNLHLLLCLDEVENLTIRADEFNDVLEDWRACAQMGQMVILTASAQPLADLCASGGLTSPFYNIFSQHRLGLMPADEWQPLLMKNMPTTVEDLAFVGRVAGGHPFFTQLTASYLWQARQQGRVDYEALYQELWFQFQAHLQHLWRSLSSDEQAALQILSGSQSGVPEPRTILALERRGLLLDKQTIFSGIFTEMIAENQLDS